MAELEVRAENKVTLSGIGTLTMEALAQAALALRSRGVPDSAELGISQSMSGNRWNIVAAWDPAPGIVEPPEYLRDPEPEVYAPPEPGPEHFCGRCGKPTKLAVGSASGWTHLDPLANKHPATKGRPARDNPQA